MPYIDPSKRRSFRQAYLLGQTIGDPGELNYVVTQLILAYLGPYPHYSNFNDIMGVLECAKQELYRRMIAPYEDEKIEENGDVYP